MVGGHLWVPGRMPGLNEILDARMQGGKARRNGKRWNAYSDMKRRWEGTLLLLARSQGFRRVEQGHFTYLCVEPDRRRDPSNVVAGAMKILEDALQQAELLAGDGWEQVRGIAPFWAVRRREPGVHLWVREDRCLTEAEARRLGAVE